MTRCRNCGQISVEQTGQLCMRCRQSTGDRLFAADQKPPDAFTTRNNHENPGRDTTQNVKASSARPFEDPSSGSFIRGLSGVISGVRSDTDPKGPLFRWFHAMFYFLPYRAGHDRVRFLLYPDRQNQDTDNQSCLGVEYEGKIAFGQLHDHLRVRVTGRRQSNGSLIANKIQIDSTGETITPVFSIHPILLWMISLLLIGLPAYAIFGISAFWQEHSERMTGYLGVGFMIIAVIALGWIILKFRFRHRRHSRGIGLVVILIGMGVIYLIWKYSPDQIVPAVTIVGVIGLMSRMIFPGNN